MSSIVLSLIDSAFKSSSIFSTVSSSNDADLPCTALTSSSSATLVSSSSEPLTTSTSSSMSSSISSFALSTVNISVESFGSSITSI